MSLSHMVYGSDASDAKLTPAGRLQPRVGEDDVLVAHSPANSRQRALADSLRAVPNGHAVSPADVQKEAQRRTQAFLKGPVCQEWLRRASKAGPAALVLGLALWAKAGLEKDNFFKEQSGESRPIEIRSAVKKLMKISASQCSRGLEALRKAGLVRVIKGGRGRCPSVTIVNIFVVEGLS